MRERYKNNRSILTDKEQELLGNSHVAIVGAGGLGGYVLEMLCRLGVGTISIFDDDVFDESNLNRQLLCTEATIGLAKVEAAVERVQCINSSVTIKGFKQRVTSENAVEILGGNHLIIDCVDSVPARFVLQESCANLGIPLVHGAVDGWMGQVAVIFPGDDVFEKIYGSSKEQVSYPSLGNGSFLPALVASYQVAEAVKILTNKPAALRGKLYQIDAFQVSDTTTILLSD